MTMQKYKTVGNGGLFDEEENKQIKQGQGDELWGDTPNNINK